MGAGGVEIAAELSMTTVYGSFLRGGINTLPLMQDKLPIDFCITTKSLFIDNSNDAIAGCLNRDNLSEILTRGNNRLHGSQGSFLVCGKRLCCRNS